FGGEVFRGVVLRIIADELLRIANVPEPAGVVGDAKENGKWQVPGGERFYQELREVARAAPFALDIAFRAQEWAVVILKIAQANHDHGHAMLVRVIACESFAKHFGAGVN